MLTRAAPGRRADDAGFTLIELILSIGLLGLIFSTLSLVMLGSMRVNDETRERLDETRDEQFVAAYFATDVAGATELVTGSAARCGTGTALVEVRGESYTAATPPAETTTVASYVFTTATVDGVVTGSLSRRVCEAATAGAPAFPWTPARTVTVAENLAGTAPVVTCTEGGVVAACSADTTSISVQFDRRSGGDPFVLSATRRTTP